MTAVFCGTRSPAQVNPRRVPDVASPPGRPNLARAITIHTKRAKHKDLAPAKGPSELQKHMYVSLMQKLLRCSARGPHIPLL